MPITPRLGWLPALTLACLSTGHAADAPARLQQQLARSVSGDVLDISAVSPAPPWLPLLNMKRTWTGGTMIYSGSPENVPAPGVLYEDTLPPGPARLMLYHVNATGENGGTARNLKLSVIAAPADPDRPATVTIRRRAVYGPQNGYFYIGTRASRDLLALPETPEVLSISAPTLLDPALESHILHTRAYRTLVEALYDLDVSGGDVKFTLVAVEEGADTLATYAGLPPAPRGERSPGVWLHDRGTFPNNANKTFSMPTGAYSTANGLTHIRLGGGASDTYGPDEWAGEGTPAGRDAMLNIPSVLRGNWGVVYTIRLRATSPDGRRLAILANPRGGVYAGAVVNSDALTGAGAFLVPTNGTPMTLSTQASLIGRWDPRATPDITILWTPPGASNMPVEFVLVPYPEPGDADGSGDVDIRDATLALRFVSGLAAPSARQKVAADVSPDPPDGALTIADAAWILQRAAGLL
jgi:hypothetical protein